MESKKADISVILVEDVKNDVNILSVHTNETKSRTLIEYVDTENWYNFDTNKWQFRYNLMLFL